MAVGQIISRAIATGAIGADQIATGAITAADIPAGEITADKLHTTLDLSSKTVTMPQASITAHQAALSITESQVSDLQSYVLPNTSPTFTNTTLTGYLAGPATFTIDPAGVGDNTGTVVIAGNLQVDGTTTTINSTTLTVDDLNITLADGAADAAAANGAGITVAGANATITYDASNDEWDFNKDVNVTGNVYSSGYVGVGTTTAYSASTDFEVKATDPKMVFNNTGIRAFGLRVTGTNFQIRDESDNETWLTITHTGIIGIGTTAPSTTASGYEGGTLHIHNAGTGSSIRLTNSTTGTGTSDGMLISKWSDSKTYFTNFDNGADMVFTPTDSSGNLVANTFVIKGDGKIGFGTSSPTATLQVGNAVSGQTGNVIINSEGGNPVGLKVASRVNRARIQVSDNDTSGFIIAEGSIFSFGFADQASNNNLNITNSHNVGIGTTEPAHKLEVVGTTKADQYLLDAVAKDISDTAVDVFVYDTRKDSDGGAWRKRTQHTSWYNETLNTSTRGSRKEFPAVAVIVAETTQVTIYDGDDPDMPMWMVFNDASNYFLNQPTVSAVTMLNGKLAVTGTASNNTSLAIGDFVSEFCQIIRSNYDGDATGLVNRNSSFWSSNKSNTRIVGNVVNDVAMTVLPNAPIDSATGLPVPTIAVATDGGVSVIKDDGTVVDITHSSSSYNYWSSVNFTKDNKLIIDSNYQGTSNNITHVVDIPNADVSQNVVNARITSLNGRYYHSDSSIPNISLGGVLKPSIAPMQVDTFAMGGDNVNYGLDIIAEAPATVSGITSDAMIAYIKSDYNTGYMVGDIKLATLSDTDDTDITFADKQLIDEPYFNASTGWYFNGNGASGAGSTTGNGWAISGGKITQSGSGGDVYAVIPVVNGVQYIMELTFDTTGNSAVSSNVSWGFRSLANSGYVSESQNQTILANNTAGQTKQIFWTANTTGNVIARCYCDENLSIDNWTVFIAEEDRSLNGNGLQVFGTVTKTPVATGADLVAYSGFGNGNYLKQPYNSDLDFGTGTFSITTWAKIPVVNSYSPTLVDRHVLNQARILLYAEYGNQQPRIYIAHTNGSTSTYVTGPTAIDDGIWHCWHANRRGNGELELWIDGVKVAYGGIGVDSISVSTNGPTIIGNDYTGGGTGYMNGDMALTRISSTAPSPEQIKKIYEDEKFLFQENAKATLYGTSNAVTSLAYDDDTELLHAGGPQGRSVFQGLRRIDNTTDAVGVAISASNGMVAED